jgi:hypothetical protein
LINNINEGDIYMAGSILPTRVREDLRKHKWLLFSKTSGVEAYTKGFATIYIQPSKSDKDFFAWVIDYSNNPQSKYGSGVTELLSDTLKK